MKLPFVVWGRWSAQAGFERDSYLRRFATAERAIAYARSRISDTGFLRGAFATIVMDETSSRDGVPVRAFLREGFTKPMDYPKVVEIVRAPAT